MITGADPERVSRAVRDWAKEIRDAHREVRRIYWYGSWVNGIPTPASDVDLCVVVSTHPARPRDRLPEYLPTHMPVGVDLIVLTQDELGSLAERAPSWHRAITSGKTL